MKKYLKYISSIAVIIITAILVMAFIGKSTTQDLQSRKWVFTSDQDGDSADAQFSQHSLVLSQAGFNVTYRYQISQHKQQEQVTFTNHNSWTSQLEKRVFKIKKNGDQYRLTAINQLAKTDTGNVSLVPK